jgi:precorrin-2 methylase
MELTEGTEVYAVSDCGLPEEKRYYGAAAIPDDGGYMTTIIIKRTGASACYQ